MGESPDQYHYTHRNRTLRPPLIGAFSIEGGGNMKKDNDYSLEDIAKMCEVAVILEGYDIEVEDLHDFFHDHVKVIYDEWVNGIDTGIFKNEHEEGYITEYANRVALERYTK